MTSSPCPAFQLLLWLADIMGKKSVFVGPQVGSGTAMKLVVNKLMAEMAASLAEATVFADKLGLEGSVLLDVIGAGVMNAPLYKLKGTDRLIGCFRA